MAHCHIHTEYKRVIDFLPFVAQLLLTLHSQNYTDQAWSHANVFYDSHASPPTSHTTFKDEHPHTISQKGATHSELLPYPSSQLVCVVLRIRGSRCGFIIVLRLGQRGAAILTLHAPRYGYDSATYVASHAHWFQLFSKTTRAIAPQKQKCYSPPSSIGVHHPCLDNQLAASTLHIWRVDGQADFHY